MFFLAVTPCCDVVVVFSTIHTAVQKLRRDYICRICVPTARKIAEHRTHIQHFPDAIALTDWRGKRRVIAWVHGSQPSVGWEPSQAKHVEQIHFVCGGAVSLQIGGLPRGTENTPRMGHCTQSTDPSNSVCVICLERSSDQIETRAQKTNLQPLTLTHLWPDQRIESAS